MPGLGALHSGQGRGVNPKHTHPPCKVRSVSQECHLGWWSPGGGIACGVCWCIRAGFLEERASGGRLWAPCHFSLHAERNLGCFAQRPVEASRGKRTQDTGAEIWGALVLLMGGKGRRESGVIQSHWPEQLSGCRCPFLRCCSGVYSLGNTKPRE